MNKVNHLGSVFFLQAHVEKNMFVKMGSFIFPKKKLKGWTFKNDKIFENPM